MTHYPLFFLVPTLPAESNKRRSVGEITFLERPWEQKKASACVYKPFSWYSRREREKREKRKERKKKEEKRRKEAG